jgi:1-acyl-sn-glycerol-3-phosphate acyltransferase
MVKIANMMLAPRPQQSPLSADSANRARNPVFLPLPVTDTVNRANWLQFKGSPLAAWLLHRAGWRIDWHGLPAAHGVFVVYPHTSNWDFIVGILMKWAIGMPINFWAKEGLFTGLAGYTIGPLMRYWGGIPVNRRAASGMIDDTVAQMRGRDYFWLALAPEGTRSAAPYWRSGFYRVVLAAGCPLGLAYFDFENKVLGATQFITLSGDEAADIAHITAYYATRGAGCKPQNAGGIGFKPLVLKP